MLKITKEVKKSCFLAYFLWVFGAFFGLHLLYLRRDKQAFLYWCTFGGYLGIAPLRDLFRIPFYVDDINNSPSFVTDFAKQVLKYKKPPTYLARFIGELLMANSWCHLLISAVPTEEIFGVSFKFLYYFAPIGTAIGVWVVGNIGRQKGSLFWPCIGAFSVLPFSYFHLPAITWSCVPSALLFEWKAKQWRRTPYVKHSFKRRFAWLSSAWLLYCSLLVCYTYFNAEITYKDGETAKLRDAITNFFNSPMYLEFKSNVRILYNDIWEHGWSEAFEKLLHKLDPLGELHALQILGLKEGVTEEELKARYKQLTKEWHPDKHKGEEEKAYAQEKFVEITNSYETLSSIKRKRKMKNKMSKVEEDR